MNLIIDIGNTNAKIAVFDHDNIVEADTIKTSNIIPYDNKNKHSALK